MLTTLKTLWRRLDFWLRNEEYHPSTEYRVHRWDDMLEEMRVPDPFRTRVYWTIRRFWINHWLCNPRSVYFDAKCAWQRLTRGWDDRAVWSIDWWLDDKMPAMLRKLKNDKHGVPLSMFDGLPTNEHGYHDDPEMKIADARWDAVLDKMIAAFEASRRSLEGLYEEELGEYPLCRPEGMSREAWETAKNERFEKSQKLQERDEQIFKEGMALFVEHYRSLWD